MDSAQGTATYKVEILVLQSGERLPLLVDRLTGVPAYDPTAFVLQTLRTRGRASNTIEQALRSIDLLLRFLDQQNVDLETRFPKGQVLTIGEVEGLARMCRFKSKNTTAEAHAPDAVPNIVPIDRILRKPPRDFESVNSATTAIRLTYIAQYLEWLGTVRLQHMATTNPAQIALRDSINRTVTAITERRPRNGGGHSGTDREGLDTIVLERIAHAIHPENPDNPWRSRHVRFRNWLMIHWFSSLGLRRAELAGIRVSNLDTPMTKVRIIRRADDAEDPRKYQPNAKTQGRDLELLDELSRRTREYVISHRRTIPGARRHDFLFVAEKTGRPLTLGAINKVFESLREKVPGLPANLSPHLLRHTWNDNFSEIADARSISEAIEHEARSYAMGWSPTSQSATHYTKRYVRRKSDELSLALQREMEGALEEEEW